MKKIFGVVAAVAMMFSGAAFAEGYINANDLTKGDVTAERAEEDGFVLRANEEKYMAIEGTKPVDSTDGDVFTQRISLKGSGKIDYRSIAFPAKKGETIKVYCASGSKTDARSLTVVDEEGNEIGTIVGDPYVDGASASVGTVKAPADGTYIVYSPKNSLYVFQIKVGK